MLHFMKRNWVFATNTDFLTSISLQPNVRASDSSDIFLSLWQKLNSFIYNFCIRIEFLLNKHNIFLWEKLLWLCSNSFVVKYQVYEHAHKLHHYLHGTNAFDAHIYGNGMPEEFFFLVLELCMAIFAG